MRVNQEVYIPYCRMAANSYLPSVRHHVDNLAGHAFRITEAVTVTQQAEERREGSR